MSFTSLLRIHQLRRASRAIRIVCAATLMAITLTNTSASAAYVNVYGGPTFTPGVGGFKGTVSFEDVNDSGTAVGYAVKYDGSGVELGSHAVRWDGSGAPAIELGRGRALDINETGTAVGYVVGLDPSYVAVRWDASGAATELGHLDITVSDVAHSAAGAVNDAGTSWKHNSSGTYQGVRAVRWDASGNATTELDNLGTWGGFALNYAYAINDAGAAVGQADIDFGLGEYYGTRPVRWDATSTEATELRNLGTDPLGYTDGGAYDINAAGTAVGSANMYDVWECLGRRAVRWDASGTAATELGNLGTDSNSITESNAVAINDAGTAVGYANLYNSGESLGRRAVRWDATGTVATELGNLGANGGITKTDVFAINDAGIAVGYADDYDDFGASLGERAVYWGLNGLAVDLNTLIDPVSGWTLNRATAISNPGWIGGSGVFDPDGPDGQDAYARLFLIQLPVPSDLPGDYNRDGTVNAADYTVWRDHLDQTFTLRNENAAAATPGVVDAEDYDFWKARFGDRAGSASGANATATAPEPTTLVLLSLATAGWFRGRHRIR